MAIVTAVGTMVIGTGAIGTTYNTASHAEPASGWKVMIIKWTGHPNSAAADAIQSNTNQARIGRGWAVSTSARRCVTGASADASAAADVGRDIRDDCVVAAVTPAGAGAGRADFNGFTSTGAQLIIDQVFGSGLEVGYMLLGDTATGEVLGSVDVFTYTKATVTGNHDFTSLSFQPAFMEIAGTAQGGLNSPSTDLAITFGAACAPGGSAKQAVLSLGFDDAATTMESNSYCTTSDLIAIHSRSVPDNLLDRASFVSFLSNGFRVNWTLNDGSAFVFVGVAIEGGLWELGEFGTGTDTTSDVTGTTGFETKGGALWSAMQTAESSAGTTQAHGNASFGLFADASNEKVVGFSDEDNLADSDVASSVGHGSSWILHDLSAAPHSILAKGGINSIGATSFAYRNTTAPAASRYVWWWAVGNAAEGGVSVTPAAAAARALALSPTVQLGSLALSPAAAVARALGLSPTVLAGSLALTPAIATARAQAVSPTVDAGGNVNVEPAAAAAKAAAVNPTVDIGGGLVIEPSAAAARALALGPSIQLGSLTITPNAAIARALAAIGNIDDGTVTVVFDKKTLHYPRRRGRR